MEYWPDFNVENAFVIENIVIAKNLTDFCFFLIKTIVITENLTDFCKLVEAGVDSPPEWPSSNIIGNCSNETICGTM